ncbi:MAG TPA: hypothetical protein VFX48_09580 [Saprospiraceae bacterium]|nr:hypothetical protein [Saprospiraceae bacterium]
MTNLKRPVVFAYPVKDLTLARYLAAKETDLIGLDLDDPDEQKTMRLLAQMREWIEGPKLIGVSARPGPELLNRFPVDGYFMDADLPLPEGSIHLVSLSYARANDECQAHYVIVDDGKGLDPSHLHLLRTDIRAKPLSGDGITGFLIDPGREEKTGLFDFDKLDDWFEQLESLAD